MCQPIPNLFSLRISWALQVNDFAGGQGNANDTLGDIGRDVSVVGALKCDGARAIRQDGEEFLGFLPNAVRIAIVHPSGKLINEVGPDKRATK